MSTFILHYLGQNCHHYHLRGANHCQQPFSRKWPANSVIFSLTCGITLDITHRRSCQHQLYKNSTILNHRSHFAGNVSGNNAIHRGLATYRGLAEFLCPWLALGGLLSFAGEAVQAKSKDCEKKVEAILAAMTLKEKIGQMTQVDMIARQEQGNL